MDRILDGSWLDEVGLGQYISEYLTVMAFIKQNQIGVAMLVFFTGLAIRTVVQKNRAAAKVGANREYLDAPDFPEIQRLEKFDWKTEEPIKLRSFKPKYYLTMGKSSSIGYLIPKPLASGNLGRCSAGLVTLLSVLSIATPNNPHSQYLSLRCPLLGL